jgi:hypothetical protein
VQPESLEIQPDTAVVAVADCSALAEALSADARLQGSRLIYRRLGSPREALRMYFETGGRGYLRWLAPGEWAAVGEGDRTVFTVFRRRAGPG